MSTSPRRSSSSFVVVLRHRSSSWLSAPTSSSSRRLCGHSIASQPLYARQWGVCTSIDEWSECAAHFIGLCETKESVCDGGVALLLFWPGKVVAVNIKRTGVYSKFTCGSASAFFWPCIGGCHHSSVAVSLSSPTLWIGVYIELSVRVIPLNTKYPIYKHRAQNIAIMESKIVPNLQTWNHLL